MGEMIAKDLKRKLPCIVEEIVQVKINKIQSGRSDFFMANVFSQKSNFRKTKSSYPKLQNSMKLF